MKAEMQWCPMGRMMRSPPDKVGDQEREREGGREGGREVKGEGRKDAFKVEIT